MSLLNIVLLVAYLSGVAALALGVGIRLGLPIGDIGARGALVFAGVSFLCCLATREVISLMEKQTR